MIGALQGGHSDPEIFLRPFGPQFGLKITRGGALPESAIATQAV